jgi:hypothetical protein
MSDKEFFFEIKVPCIDFQVLVITASSSGEARQILKDYIEKGDYADSREVELVEEQVEMTTKTLRDDEIKELTEKEFLEEWG